MTQADVIVIGAGIVGAATAHELVQRGLEVLVLDARLGAATDAGMGHLVMMDDDAAEFALCRDSLAQWQQWAPQMDATCAYQACATLWLAADAAEQAAAQAKRQRLHGAGLAAQWLDAAQLAQAEPALRAGLAGALRVDGDALVYAPRAANWLLAQAGRRLHLEAAQVVRIDQGSVLLRDGSQRHGAAVVLAAGMHATRLCPDLPLRARKGQLVITDRTPHRLRHSLVELGYMASAHGHDPASVAFNVQPRPTGQLLIGSSRRFDAADAQLEPALLGRMLRRALHYLPGLGALNAVRAWTGVRAATPDGRPLIGAHAQRRGLWLALGHEGLGVTLAPGTARLLADLLLGAVPALDAAPYAPARFAMAAART